MLINVSKKIELLANVAIIVVACLLTTILIKNYLITKRSDEVVTNESQRIDSATLAGLGIDWRQGNQTLLLAVSSTCHFCTESAPFYKLLAQERGKTRLVAILPQSVDEGQRYLAGLGVTVDEIRQVPLGSMNVTGTPTLLLVNRDGVVIRTWIGKLADEQQGEVLKWML
jgi:hypothetical protein